MSALVVFLLVLSGDYKFRTGHRTVSGQQEALQRHFEQVEVGQGFGRVADARQQQPFHDRARQQRRPVDAAGVDDPGLRRASAPQNSGRDPFKRSMNNTFPN